MNFRAFIPPVVGLAVGAVVRSFASSVARWVRGDDIIDGPRDTFTEPYRVSAWIRAAVCHIADEVSGRPLKFYQGDNEFEDTKLATFWDKPAQGPKTAGKETRLSIEEAIRDLASWDALEGELFLVIHESWLLATASRLGASLPPFLIANPQRMQAVLMSGELAGWRYIDAGGKQHIFLPEQVIHRKAFNPYDDWRGLGGLQAAKVAAEGAFLTGVYVRNLARNNGDQGMVVIAKAGVVSTEQREQVLASLREKRIKLNRGIASDTVLGGDITVDRPKEQAASPELMTSKTMSHEEVFIAFRVPPSMTAVKAAYSIGKESDKYQLITGTCQPVGNRIASAFAEIASRQAGRALTAELDWDDHPVMIEVRNSRLDSALKLWAVGMPLKDANDYLGLGMKPFRGWDVGYLPFAVAPVDLLAEPAKEPSKDPRLAEPAADEPDEVKTLRLLVAVRQRQRVCINVTPKSGDRDPFAAYQCCFLDMSGEMRGNATKGRSAAEIAQWRTLMSKRRETVRSFESAFGRVLTAARTETLRKIEASQTAVRFVRETDIVACAAVADLLFDLAKFADGFFATMRDRQKVALNTAGKQLFAEVGKDDPFVYPAEEVLNFLAARENKLADTPKEIHEEIKAALEEGIIAGETQEQLSARVRSAFNGVSSERARRIAMTETGAAYGAGRDEAMVQAGVQYKKWLTIGNDNVRAAHAAANGQTVPIDQPFEVDGEQLMFPGDDSGSAGNVINCHCVSIAVASAEEDDES